MRARSWVRILVGILFISVLVVGVQAAKPTPPAETYTSVKNWTFNGTPWGLAVDSSHGLIYITDHEASYINQFDTAGNLLQCWTGRVNWGLAVDQYGYVYTDGVNETGYDNIYKLNFKDGNYLQNMSTGYLSGNRGLDLDSEGNIYVAEWRTNSVKKYNKDGVLTDWNPSSQLNGPEGVAINDSKWVYVTDQENHRFQRFNYTTGAYDNKTTLSGFSNRNGKFSGAEGIAVDDAGNIYITDDSNKNAQKYSSDGTLITYWGNFNNPAAIDVDGNGNVYVLDSTGILVYTSSANPRKAAFTAIPTSGTVPLTVKFTDQSTGAFSYDWDFGDGTPHDLVNSSPLHTYSDVGSGYYTAKLTINGVGGPSKEVTITVQKRPITVTAIGINKVYDGGITATATLSTDKVSGDDVTATGTATFDNKDVGTGKTVTVNGITISGGDAGNYALTSTTATTTAAITARPITVTADSGQSKVYGVTPDPVLTYQITSGTLVGTGSFSGALSRAAGENVGTYAITQGDLSAGANYALTYVGADFAITKIGASVTPNPAGKTYGDPEPATLTGTTSGFLVADGVTAAYSREAGETVAGSPYKINAVLSPAGVLGNYDITYNTADFTISKKAASVIPDAAGKTYGDPEPATLTGTLDGFQPADGVTATYSREVGETVGLYTIRATLSPAEVLGNYDITYNTADFTIKEPLTANFTNVTARVGHDSNDPYNLTVQFTDKSTSSGTIKTWQWSSEEGIFSSTQNPTYKFSSDLNTGQKTYNITLNVTDDTGAFATKTENYYIAVSPLQDIKVTDDVTLVENDEYPDGIPGGVSFSAAQVGADSCVEVQGCKCAITDPNDENYCSRAPPCSGSDLTLVFIDRGFQNMNEGTELPAKWIQANPAAYKCDIRYVCGGKIIQDYPVECKAKPLDSKVAYADGLLLSEEEGIAPHDPKAWYPTCQENCNNYYALLIDGGVNQTQNHQRYWYDISFMYTTLIEYGYPANHIKVLMSDGTNADSVTGKDRHISNTGTMYDSSPLNLDGNTTTNEAPYIFTATKASLNSTLDSYANVTAGTNLPKNATLFIFTTGHGDRDNTLSPAPTANNNTVKYSLWGNDYITDKEFVGKLNAINCSAIIMVMEQCYGGGFYDEFIKNPANVSSGNGKIQNRTLITATNWSEVSWANGFSNAWTTGVAGHSRWADINTPMLDDTADQNPKDSRISMRESYNYTLNVSSNGRLPNDPFASDTLTNHEHPQIWSTYTGGLTQLTQYLNDCTATVPKNITLNRPTVTGISWPRGSQRYIYWTAKGMPTDENVNITLWKGGVANTTPIASSVGATKKFFRWIIPDFQPTGSNYKVKVASLINQSVNDSSKSDFTIAPKANNVTFNLQSVPSDANVTIDYVPLPYTNNTNTTFTNIRPGEYLITLDKLGYISKTEMAILPTGNNTKVMTLIDASGSNSQQWSPISINSDPAGAKVFIDGSDTGYKTPLEIDVTPGLHKVAVTSPCTAKPAEKDVVVPEFESESWPESVTFALPMCYIFQGFESPIDMNALNTANAGKALPLKWHLSDTGGQNILDPASFVKVQSFNVTCPNSPPPLDQNKVESYTGSSNLRNMSYGNWTFNVDTPRTYKGSCRNMSVVFNTFLAEGSNQTSPNVTFKFN